MSAVLSFALACASATFFLILRCHGRGRAFGRSSRRWAFAVIFTTGALSTAVTLATLSVVHHLPAAFFSLGVVAPSGLWLSEIHNKRDGGERGPVRDMSTLWLLWMLARLHEGMAEDRLAWSEERVDPQWSADDLGLAARFYHEYLTERLSSEQRRRARINAHLQAIETRLTVAGLIDGGAARSKVVAALQQSRATRDPRYSRYQADLGRLGDILRHDAARDLVRMVGYAYTAGQYAVPVYRAPASEP